MHFSLMWSYFEAEALHTRGSSRAVAAWIRRLNAEGKLETAAFSNALNYFKNRYYSAGSFTRYFNSLNLRPCDNPELVRAVLSGDNTDPVDAVVVLFIVIYRFRNNYFHGSKWAYHLQGQIKNFRVASDSLMAAMDMWRP